MTLARKHVAQLEDLVESLDGTVTVAYVPVGPDSKRGYPKVTVTLGGATFVTHRPTVRDALVEVERWLKGREASRN
jgi:hypothetical protein